ncbi:hypothetical protein F2Q70_00014952 [Brassica cretica]|uniref:Uncharacterized protein n=1 Tax=Brassica cretica TaxID=69181 RepID=A0A8S9KRM4_BRACR|nr:hypothetical protein F2Q70_00014952 [Brassica cretica]KAF2597079.1 hypothetical protein F2Q68_00008060 [Brassica cretica]
MVRMEPPPARKRRSEGLPPSDGRAPPHNNMAQEEPKTLQPHLSSLKTILSYCRAEERSTESPIHNRYAPLLSLCAG